MHTIYENTDHDVRNPDKLWQSNSIDFIVPLKTLTSTRWILVFEFLQGYYRITCNIAKLSTAWLIMYAAELSIGWLIH